MEQKPDSLATAETATELGVGKTTVWRACKKLPGFSTRVLGEHRIPRSHIARVKHGEALQDIIAACGQRSEFNSLKPVDPLVLGGVLLT